MCSTSRYCFLNLRTYFVYFCCYLLVMVVTGSRLVHGLKCYCNPKECDVIRPSDCPGKGILFWDPCKCCRLCAKIVGETCGGPGGFSGKCEPPLQCVARLPITSGIGVCTDLTFPIYLSSNHQRNCSNDKTIVVESGCEITNTRCKCWPPIHVCHKDVLSGRVPSEHKWHFKNFEECQLNLKNIIDLEMEFDEDFTVSPSTFTYKKMRRKRHSSLKRRPLTTF